MEHVIMSRVNFTAHAQHSTLDTIVVRDDIKSSGKFAIFTRLKIEWGGGRKHNSEILPLKIQTVEDIDVKMTQNDMEGNRDRK